MSIVEFIKNAEATGVALDARQGKKAYLGLGYLGKSKVTGYDTASDTLVLSLDTIPDSTTSGKITRPWSGPGTVDQYTQAGFTYSQPTPTSFTGLTTMALSAGTQNGWHWKISGKGFYIDASSGQGIGETLPNVPSGLCLVKENKTGGGSPPMWTLLPSDPDGGTFVPDQNPYSTVWVVYETLPPLVGTVITAADTSGWPSVTFTTSTAHGFADGDTANIGGLTGFNCSNLRVVAVPTGTTFTVTYPNFEDTAPTYPGGGQVRRPTGVRLAVSDDGMLVSVPRTTAPRADVVGPQTRGSLALSAGAAGWNPGAGWGFYVLDDAQRWRRVGCGAGAITCTAGAAIITAASNTIRSRATLMLSAAGAVTVGTATTTPILPDSYDGHCIRLLNTSANNITLTDQGTMAASNLRLTATTVVLGPRDSIELTFSTAVGDWVQTGNLVNVL